MATPIPEIREVCAHTLQLCDHVIDANTLTDLRVLQAKAQMIKQLIGMLYGDAPKAPVEEDISDLL